MPKIFRELFFEEALPRLVVTYNKGKLVPFTGAGISAPSIPTWKGFLDKLRDSSNSNFSFDKNKIYTPQELIQVSEEIVTSLSRKSKESFISSVRESLGYANNMPPITEQCRLLSKIWWPLILSTNYDTMYLEALKENPDFDESQISFFGRNVIDCHSLLAALKSPSKTSYWALQGYLGRNHTGKELTDEIVVGYRQYRNATFNNPTFRSVFGEIFRSHSLFFLGTGLSEDYFRGLFGEVLEKFGSNPHTHCALFNYKDINSIDHHFLHTKFNITSMFYEDHGVPYSGLGESLKKLHECINQENHKLSQLSYSRKNFVFLSNNVEAAKLEIVFSSMPPPKHKHCNVYSAGFQNGILLSHQGIEFVNKYYNELGNFNPHNFKETAEPLVKKYLETDLYAAIARDSRKDLNSHDSRDLRIISTAVENVLKVTNGQYEVINIMLLAAGRGRVFPPVYSFIQMIRGYKNFIKATVLKSIFRIHIVDPSVIFYLRTNALEIEEILNCTDIRLNIEIRDKDEIERYQIYLDENITIAGVSNFYSIDAQYWNVKIVPSAFKNQSINPSSTETLSNAGLIPGSLILYTRKEK